MHAIQYKRFSSNRSFGVELEVGPEVPRKDIASFIKEVSFKSVRVPSSGNGWAQSLNNDFWHVKYDATCGPLGKYFDHGWEVASYKASGYQDLQHIGKIANHLRRRGLTINDNCGLHVHVGVGDFEPEQIGVLLANWFKIENVMMQCIAPDRRITSYCSPLVGSKMKKLSLLRRYDPLEFWKIICPTDISIHENNQKQVALNLVNYARSRRRKTFDRSTIEFRFPEGTLDGECIKNWVQLFVSFVDNYETLTMPRNLKCVDVETTLNILGLSNSSNFYILSRTLYNAKVWFLKRLALHATNRKIQISAKKLLETCTMGERKCLR